MSRIDELAELFEEKKVDDLPYELFDVSDIRADMALLRNAIAERAKEIEAARENGGVLPENDEVTLAQLMEWQDDNETVQSKCSTILEFIRGANAGFLLVKRQQRSSTDEALWIAQEMHNWFLQEPVAYYREAEEADRAEVFYNTFAFLESEGMIKRG